MFAKREDAQEKSRVTLRAKESKQLRGALPLCLCAAAPAALDALLPARATLQQVRFGGGARHVGYAVEHAPVALIDLDPKAPAPYRLLPTLAGALWRLPAAPPLLPTLLVPPAVSTFLVRGADLMLAGVLLPSSGALPAFARGALVAVRVAGNPAALAVGEALQSASECVAGGMRGKGVRVLHVYGDALWEAGGRVCPNRGFAGDRVEGIGAEEPELCAAAGAAASAAGAEAAPGAGAAEGEGGGSGGGGGGGGGGAPAGSGEAQAQAQGGDTADDPEAQGGDGGALPPPGKAAALPWWTSATPDALLLAVLLQCLQKRRHLPLHLLPILPSALLGSVMGAARPRGTHLLVKRTTWKKFSAFLAAMAEEGLLVLDSESRLVSWDAKHPLLTAHRAWPAAVECAKEEGEGEGEGGGGGGGGGVGAAAGAGGSSSGSSSSGGAVAWCPPTVTNYLMASRAQLPVVRAVLIARLFEWCSKAQAAVEEGLAGGGGGSGAATAATSAAAMLPPLSLLGTLLLRAKRHRGGPASARSLGTRLLPLGEAVLPRLRRLVLELVLQGSAKAAGEGGGSVEEEVEEEE